MNKMDGKLRCILLDDELPGLKFLKILCEQIPQVEVIRSFTDPLQLIADFKNIQFDFCIIDVEMPHLNGFDIAEVLKGYPVIFATAYKQYAYEAFNINAVDYIIKPISLGRLQQAVQKVADQLAQQTVTAQLSFNTNKGKALVDVGTILLIETAEIDSRDKMLWLSDNSSILLKNISFDRLITTLPADRFVRINKKQVIALKIIKFLSGENITTELKDDLGLPRTLTLGESFKKSVLSKIR